MKHGKVITQTMTLHFFKGLFVKLSMSYHITVLIILECRCDLETFENARFCPTFLESASIDLWLKFKSYQMITYRSIMEMVAPSTGH